MGVWKQVGQSLGGIVKTATQAIWNEPGEILENAVSDKGGDNQGIEALEQGTQTQSNTQQSDDAQGKSFKTQQDFNKYQQLSGKKDELELNMLRRRLFSEYGLNTDLETGMKKARQEYEEKEEERKKQEEEEKKQEDWVVEKKKQEDMAVVAARQTSSAENKAWGAGGDVV